MVGGGSLCLFVAPPPPHLHNPAPRGETQHPPHPHPGSSGPSPTCGHPDLLPSGFPGRARVGGVCLTFYLRSDSRCQTPCPAPPHPLHLGGCGPALWVLARLRACPRVGTHVASRVTRGAACCAVMIVGDRWGRGGGPGQPQGRPCQVSPPSLGMRVGSSPASALRARCNPLPLLSLERREGGLLGVQSRAPSEAPGRGGRGHLSVPSARVLLIPERASQGEGGDPKQGGEGLSGAPLLEMMLPEASMGPRARSRAAGWGSMSLSEVLPLYAPFPFLPLSSTLSFLSPLLLLLHFFSRQT